MKNIYKLFVAGILSLSLLTGTSFAAPAWQIPTQGKVFYDAAKQIYIADTMKKLLSEQFKVEFSVPSGWKYEKFTVNGVDVERLANPKQKKSARVVLQLHGGGYVGHLSQWYRDFAIKQAVMTEAREIYMVDYRVAPEHIYPAALDDTQQAYEELLKRGIKSENIIVFGDSAGGNLALALSLRLKEKNLPQPAMLILLSPRTTFETDLPSRSDNANRDLVLGKNNSKMYNAVFNPVYAGKIPLNDPHLSPIYADLKGLPPTLVQIGGYELFVDDGIELLKKATADELNITLSVYQRMPHDFSVLLPDLDESVKSFIEIKNFVNLYMPKTLNK
ncbi:MAG: alpha/beta hydrolase [Selenomonadaceae bacterium]|nr:alpha/beta hydrolase [Selenomonadaceae bacterium]